MPDVFDPEKRSQVMSQIRSTGTKPEQFLEQSVRTILGSGWEIQTHRTDLPGKPDLCLPELSLVLFIDGCFFHQCPRHGRIPDSNRDYWLPKLSQNVARDRRNRRQLRARGWSVWRFWEHDAKTIPAQRRAYDRLKRALN